MTATVVAVAASHLDMHVGYDVVVSNILAGPLIRLAPELARLSRAQGLLGLSGILHEQAERVIEAYEPFYEQLRVEQAI